MISSLKTIPMISVNQHDDNLPPGFVGARGRRNKPSLWDYKFINENKRNAGEEYKAFTESFPDIWTHFKGEPIDTSDEIMSARLASGKKSDNIVYKDGFLGVRG
ncbi:unnamed protein product [Medioppia subpectinata]|uniref:Uncharacterized protein n=1 Tax=Medioppia subpectinata TaxID=1979941 RepID=A0A7R9Q753_9ACAR|nr:unnamed protein product [Medioppia subpectinata]CAG2115195.1 unnamed protein product [Medioppia subpectinata]